MCFGTSGIILYKSRDVEIAQDADGVYITGGIEKGGVGRKKNIYILEFRQFLGSTCEIS